MDDPAFLLDALMRAMRVLACVTGALVVIDSAGVLLSYPERPPHRPRANATAWMIAAAASALVGGYLLTGQYGFVGPEGTPGAKAATIVLWAGLAAAFTARAVTRAHRPWLVLASAALMGLGGTALALLDAGG